MDLVQIAIERKKTLKVELLPKDTLRIRTTVPCSITGETFEIDVDRHDYYSWTEGDCIQCALPDLFPFEREILKTGITPAEWNRIFGV